MKTLKLESKTFSTSKFQSEVASILKTNTFNILNVNVYEMFSDNKYQNIIASAERVNKEITLTIY